MYTTIISKLYLYNKNFFKSRLMFKLNLISPNTYFKLKFEKLTFKIHLYFMYNCVTYNVFRFRFVIYNDYFTFKECFLPYLRILTPKGFIIIICQYYYSWSVSHTLCQIITGILKMELK